MKLRRTGLLAIPMAIGVMIGCDEGGGGGAFTSTGDTGFPIAVNDVLPMATQVGSEGFWGCPLEELTPVADPSATIDALGGSPVDLTAAHVGTWPIVITPSGAAVPITGALALVDLGAYGFADVTDGPGCVDHLVASVSGTVTRDTGTHALGGLIAIRPAAVGRLLLSGEDLDEAGAIWGAPTLAGALAFRLEGDLDPSALDGTASYVDCVDPMAACPSAALVAEVDGAR